MGGIAGRRLVGRDRYATTIIGTLVSEKVLFACRLRVKQLGAGKRSRLSLVGPLSLTRRSTCGKVLVRVVGGSIMLLRNIASDKGARVCVRLVEGTVRRRGRILCLLPRVTLAMRVVRHLREIFNSQLNVCRSGCDSTRHMRV